LQTRIIAKLEVKPPYVVKPVMFEGLRKVGMIKDLMAKYFEQGSDEIAYIDIVASLYRRDILFDSILDGSKDLYIPLGVGGGIRDIDDISKLIHSGADKVIINTHLLAEDPNLINEASSVFGKQAIVVNIEAKKTDNDWICYTDGGKIASNRYVLEWVKEVEQRGAGEILLQSIDCDGVEKGFDLELCKKVVDSVNIPVVVSSGAGSLEDIKEVIEYAKPSGVALSSILHHNSFTIQDIKNYLRKNNIKVSK